MIHSTPRGFRDILPQEALTREKIAGRVREVFSAAGYLPVETPLLESREVLERAGRIKGVPFQLIDDDDRLLMLRPDLTLPIARMVASRLSDPAGFPLRLRYQAPVVREQQSLRGEARQFTQLGIELVGAPDGEAEQEVLQLLAQTLDAAGIKGWTIVCGSVQPLRAALDVSGLSEEQIQEVLSLVHESDLVGLDAYLDACGLCGPVAQAIREIPRLSGGSEVIGAIDALLEKAQVEPDQRGTQELSWLVGSLDVNGSPWTPSFDFSIINSFDYYTGLIFKAYAPGCSASVASGGRYDAVLSNLDARAAACGFALSLERVQASLDAEKDIRKRPLRIAVPKGSLFAPTVELLKRAGLPTEELDDLGRKLIVNAGEVEYLIVRATDAPAFVAYGGADCGICGNDSLFEANLDLIQLVDLKVGACHFVVAEPASRKGFAEKAFARRGSYRVATKYPRITQAYYDSIGCPVDIVALHGNIELGPIVGMADRIVDITATGTTLKENDLVVVDDDVMNCSARFFASPAAYRRNPQVRTLAEALSRIS